MASTRWGSISTICSVSALLVQLQSTSSASVSAGVLSTSCSSDCLDSNFQSLCLVFESEDVCSQSISSLSKYSSVETGSIQCMSMESDTMAIYLSKNPDDFNAKVTISDGYTVISNNPVVVDARKLQKLDDDFSLPAATKTLAIRGLNPSESLAVSVSTSTMSGWKALDYLSLRNMDLSEVDILPTFSALDVL